MPDLLTLTQSLCDHYGQRCGFAICLRLLPDFDSDEGTPSTFEFRYLQMTFDIDLIQKWTAIISTILQVSAGPLDTYKCLLDDIVHILHTGEVQRSDTVWREMLDVLGLAHDIPFWEAQLEKYEQGEEMSLVEDGILQKLPLDK